MARLSRSTCFDSWSTLLGNPRQPSPPQLVSHASVSFWAFATSTVPLRGEFSRTIVLVRGEAIQAIETAPRMNVVVRRPRRARAMAIASNGFSPHETVRALARLETFQRYHYRKI